MSDYLTIGSSEPNDQRELRPHNVPTLSQDAQLALAHRVLPDTPPKGEVPYFLPFDPNDLTTRVLQYEILSAGGSGVQAIIDAGGIDLVSLAKRPYHVEFADGESFDGPAYSLFDSQGRHYLVYAASAVRDLDNLVRVWGYPPYSPPIKLKIETVYRQKNRMYKVSVSG